VRVYKRKPKDDERVSFTIGNMDAQLSDDVVKEYKLGPALKRIGKALAAQYNRSRVVGSNEIIGVKLNTLGFQLLLAKKVGKR
jgi:hypothetical protein